MSCLELECTPEVRHVMRASKPTFETYRIVPYALVCDAHKPGNSIVSLAVQKSLASKITTLITHRP